MAKKRRKPSQSDKVAQTKRSFQDKWRKNATIGVEQTLDPESNFQKWILERNGWATPKAAAAELQRYSRILDAGCGNGRVTALLGILAPRATVMGVDQADVAIARRNGRSLPNLEFVQGDLRKPLGALGKFDFVYCQEVLHHTGDPVGVFRRLASLLREDGKIAIYVYRKKAPAREYMDDYVRERIAGMEYEEAMQICRQITALGRDLSNVPGEVEVPEIPVLGIAAGRYTPQRLLYHFFLKCYWNPALSAEENAVINFDWYHPHHSSRHTLDEVLRWFADTRLRVTHQHEDLYGITVHGVRAG